MLKMDYFTVLFVMTEVLEHIHYISGALAVFVGILFGIFFSERQLIRWIVLLADALLKNTRMFTSTVKYKLLRSSFSLTKSRKPQRHYSTRRFRLVVVLLAIGCRFLSDRTSSVAHPNFEFQNSASEEATFELLSTCPFLLSENQSKSCDVDPTKLVVVCIAGQLKIELIRRRDSQVAPLSKMYIQMMKHRARSHLQSS